MNNLRKRIPFNPRFLVFSLGPAALLMLAFSLLVAADADTASPYQVVYDELIPAAGTETDYGLPLEPANLPQFIAWSYDLSLAPAGQETFKAALIELVSPCCNDNSAFRCCCEQGGRSCNIIRSEKGLAAYLIRELGYGVEQTRAAVLQWFMFARPDYYFAHRLNELGIDPTEYGVTTRGSCCRGMGELIEQAIDDTDT